MQNPAPTSSPFGGLSVVFFHLLLVQEMMEPALLASFSMETESTKYHGE